MSPSLKNPFGLRNKQLVTVDEVLPGLECDCTCPKCGARLVAKHGDSGRQSHFAHYQESDCGASYETAAHMIAKEILKDTKAIMLPYLDVESTCEVQSGTPRLKERLVERKLLRFDDAKLEVRMDGRVPDVVLYKGNQQLAVEIVVTNDITPEKLSWIREKNLETVKVNLTWTNYATFESDVRKSLSSGYSPHRYNIMHWVHHPLKLTTQERLNQQYLESITNGTVLKTVASPAKSTGTWVPPKRERSLFD